MMDNQPLQRTGRASRSSQFESASAARPAAERRSVMPKETPVLEYSPAGSDPPAVWRYAVRGVRWCWHNRHHISGVAACALACLIVFVAFEARIVLATSIDSWRRQAWSGLYLSKWALLLVALLWLGARRSRWSTRLARTSFVIAAIWWLYVQYMVHGGRGTWYW